MTESAVLIERWTNTERVLVAMPQHDRERHWNMGTWGHVNECGTVACAAGQCGLDPWFRERGFTLNFRSGQPVISNVPEFFGLEGTERIFLNTSQRAVETVIDEVRAYIGEMSQLAALSSAPDLPNIGEEWPGQGGIFAGARFGMDGAPNYHLIVGPEHAGGLDWDRANSWAHALEVDGHKDFVLPYRLEQRSLFDRVRNLFQPVSYWSCEQHASGSDCAWGQYFHYGGQDRWDKLSKLRARAVRRLTIQ